MENNKEYIREYVRQGLVSMLDCKAMPMKRRNPKVSRNAPCPCGSGKKYKRCCINK